MLTDIVFVRQDAKKGPRSTMALDRQWFFSSDPPSFKGCQSTTQSAYKYADSAFLFVQHCCISSAFFRAFRPNAPLIFSVKCAAGLATKCPVKRNMLVTKGGFSWTKQRWGRTSLSERCWFAGFVWTSARGFEELLPSTSCDNKKHSSTNAGRKKMSANGGQTEIFSLSLSLAHGK